MWNTPEFYVAIFSGVTLLIYIGAVVLGATVFIWNKLDGMKAEILSDVKEKHEQNQRRYDALNTLVIRHDTMLDPEFNGNYGAKRGR
jgi:hypothetical protein